MKPKTSRSVFEIPLVRNLVAAICAILLVPGDLALLARPVAQADSGQAAAGTIAADQLDSLVAPIALYPDPLLSQTLVASTYPLEVIQLQQWLDKNKNLKDQALADAVKKQDWDPSIQALAALPDVVKLLSENIKWTTDLGNAFLTQQNDVMDAVQRMRKKAQDAGNLKNNQQQKVETKVIENKQVIIVEQASPQVVYVPSYNPTVVYGAAPVYAYPPIVYPPVGYYAAGMAISFGVGVAMGAAWGGGWGWNCGWGGHNNIYVNNNNNFINNSNRNFNNQNINNRNANYSNRTTSGSGNTWQHNPQHRGGAPYGDRTTANRYGGTTGGQSLASRQQNAQRNQAQRGGLQQAGERGSLGGSQPGTPNRNAGARGQPGAGASGGRDTGNRGANANPGNRGALGGGGGGGGDRVGNRSVPSGGGGGAFGGGGGGGFNGGNARASSSRGASSFGGGARGGGGRRPR